MKKAFFSHIQVCLRILKETYDDQYQECLSTLGENEVQFKFGTSNGFFFLILIIETKLSEVPKSLVFQKRDKLAYSPDQNKEQERVEQPVIGSQEPDFEEEMAQRNLQDLIAKTQHQIYQFDRVFNDESSDFKIFQELLEKHSIAALRKKKNVILFNLFKSNTIVNLQMEENILNTKDFKEVATQNSKIGVLPVLLNQIFQNHNLTTSTPSKLFEKSASFDTITISAYAASGNKFYNLLTTDCKQYNSPKEIKKSIVDKLTCLKPILTTLKSLFLNKKMTIDFICYKIKIYDSKLKIKGNNSKITFFDFPNPFEKNLEKIEKADKDSIKRESFPENFIQPLRIIHSLLSNEKDNSVSLFVCSLRCLAL